MPDGTAFSVTLDKDAAQTQQPFSVTLDKDKPPAATATASTPGFSVTLDKDRSSTAPAPNDAASLASPSIPAAPVAPAPGAVPPVPALPGILQPDQIPTVTVVPQPASPAPMLQASPDLLAPVPTPPTALAPNLPVAPPPAPVPPVPALSGIFPDVAPAATPAAPAPLPAPVSLEDRMVPQPGQRVAPQIPDQVLQNAAGFEHVLGATRQGFQNTPDALTPTALAFADKWGLGTNARDVNLIVKALGAGFSGGLAMIYETAKGLGMPEPLARDLTAMAETGGMTGAPHVPGRGAGPHMRSLEEQAFMPAVTPDRGPGPGPPRELAPPPPPPPRQLEAPPPPEPPPPQGFARMTPRQPTGDIPPDVPVQVSPTGQAHVVGLQTTPPVETPPVQAAPVQAPPVQAPPVETPAPQTVTTPPDDRSDITTGGPGPAAPVGQTGAAIVQSQGEPGVVGGQGDQIPGAGDHQQAPPAQQQQTPAAGAVPPEVKPAPAPAVTPASTGKRPVTTEEMAALVGADNKARQALAKAERSPKTTPEQLAALQQRARDTRDQLDRSQGPPTKPTNVFGGPNVGGDLAKTHQAALAEHQAAVDARVHAEGAAPETTGAGADKIFAMAGQKIVRGTDTAGNAWVGTGHALVRGTSLDRAAAQTAKLKTSTSQTVDPGMLDKVVKPDPKVTYQPVTWEREVTHPGGARVVIGTRPDDTHVTVQKPVYHALIAAAGPGGTIVSGPARKISGKLNTKDDDRLFARNAQGEITGVGMPIRGDQAQTRVFARGSGQPTPGTAAAAAPPTATAAAATTPGKLSDLAEDTGTSDEVTPVLGPDLFDQGEEEAALDQAAPVPISSKNVPGQAPIVRFRQDAAAIEAAQPPVADGYTRLWRGNRADEVGAGRRFTNDLPGIALPFREGYGGPLSYVDVPTADLPKYLETGAVAPGAEFMVPPEIARTAKQVDVTTEPVPDQAPEEEPPPAPGSQLDLLMATRERLAGQATLSDTDNIKLQAVEKQIRRLQSAQRKGRPPPVVREDAGPAPLAVPTGRYVAKDFDYYKLNNGTSVWQSVFAAAGVDPTLAQLKPLTWQNKVLSDHLKDHFGFRDVKVMPGTNPLYARDTMLNLIRSAQDMAYALGMRASLISLDGKLAFQVEPRGKRDYLGAYDGGTRTIHLVNDANSFGHEWIHALDHHLTDELLNNPQMQDLLSRHTRAGELDVRDGAQAAFAKLINTMFYDAGAAALHRVNLEQQAARIDKAGNPTKGALEAQRNLDALDKAASQQRIQSSEFRTMAAQFGKPSYWASAHEMLARAGESWIARQMENNGVDPRGVVMPDEAYLNETDRRLKMTFPKDEERLAIHAAYTDLFDRLKNDGIITGPTAPKADFLPATLNWSRQVPASVRRSTFGELVRRELQGLSAGLKQLLHPVDFLTGGDLRPPPPGTLPRSVRAADMARAVVYSYGANMRIIIGRNRGPGGRALQAIYDKVAPDPGSGRLVGETFTEEHRALDNIWRNRMAAIYAKHGVPDAKSLTAHQMGMLHHVMTTGDTFYPDTPFDRSRNAPGTDIPENLQRIAADLTKLLNQFYRDLDTAGFKVGVAPNNYFPRMYDLQRVYSDPTGFHAAATKMYQFEFDKAVGDPGDNPVKLLEQWTQLSKAERAASDPSIPPAMKALRKNLRQQAITRRDLEANPGDPTLQAKLDALIDEARQIAEDNHELVRDHIADLEASEWTARILIGDPHEFEKLGPSGRFLNARKLSPEADQIMRDYMHTDPRVAILRYIDSGTRRIAWANAFGKDESFLKGQIEKAMNAGVAGPDLQDFQSLLNRATGRIVMNTPRKYVQLSNMMHAAGAAVLMGRAAWSSLAEPLNASLATGELKAGFHMLATQFSSIWDKAGAHERSEIADLFGITTSATFDSIMQARTGAEYSDSPAADRFMTQFYRTTLLTQLTNSQRQAAVGTADWLLRKWARDLQSQNTGRRADNRRDDAKRMFNELGISTQGNNLRDQFANWVLSHDGPVPLSELQTSEFRGVYGLAMRRLVDRMIQNPYKIDRPESSGLPIVSLATQLMSFNYTYQKNVLEVAFKRIHHAGQRGYRQGYDKARAGGAGEFRARARGYATGARDTAGALAFAAVAVSTIILGSLLTSMPRQRIYASKQWNDHVRDGDLGTWLTGVAISRSGLGGTLDPVGQVFDMFRWNSDLSSLYDGAFVGWLTRNAQNLIAPFTGKTESPDTNTQYYNQARAFYNLFFVPTEILGLTMLNAAGTPGMTVLTSTLLQSLTSPAAADKFAETVAGPQGSTRPKAVDEDAEDTADAELPDDKDLQMPDGKPRQRGGEAPSNVPQIPLSFLDDIAVPMVKVLEAPWKLLPGYAKVGAAGIAALLYGTHWWQETAPWRDHPNPPDKHPKKAQE